MCSMPAKGVRNTVNLTEDEELVLGPFLDEGSRERDELARATADDGLDSDSAVLAALARLGAAVVRDRMLEQGYAELAAVEDGDDRAFTAFSAGEGAKRWAGA